MNPATSAARPRTQRLEGTSRSSARAVRHGSRCAWISGKTYRIVLTEGRFISADGFELSDEGMIAVLDAKKSATDGILTLALTWADEGCSVR